MLFKNIIISWDMFRHRLSLLDATHLILFGGIILEHLRRLVLRSFSPFPQICPNPGNLFLFSMFFSSLLSPLMRLKDSAWEHSRNCGRFSSFSSRPFIRKPRRCDQLCRLAITAFAILWDFYVRFLFYASVTLWTEIWTNLAWVDWTNPRLL